MWARIVNVILGVWLLAAPAVLSYGDPARTNDRIVGPLAAAIAAIAAWEVTRPVRWLNLILGLWLFAAPWLLGYEAGAMFNAMIVGLVLAACALVRGEYRPARFGGGWAALRRSGATGDGD